MLAYKNHVNPHNIYGQVGLLGLTVIGLVQSSFPSKPEQPTMVSRIPSLPTTMPVTYNSAYGDPQEISTSMDTLLSMKIRELTEAKADAAEIEDYQLCNQLKKAIQKLKDTGVEILKLEQAKKAAVSKEDYEQASQIKTRIDQKKIEALQSIPNYSGKDDSDLEHLISISNGRTRRERSESAKSLTSSSLSEETKPDYSYKPYIPSSTSNGDLTREHSLPSSSQSQERPKLTKQRDSSSAKLQENKQTESDLKNIRKEANLQSAKNTGKQTTQTPPRIENPDERPIQPATQFSPINRDDLPLPAVGNTKYRFEDMEGAYPPGFNKKDLPKSNVTEELQANNNDPKPKELNEKIQKELSTLIDMFGLDLITDIWASNSWKEREEAIKKIEENISTYTEDPPALLSNGCKIVEKSIADKIAGVFIAGLDFFKELVLTCTKARVKREVTKSAVTGILLTLTEKLGDSNTKIRDQAADICFFLAEQDSIGPSMVVNTLTKKQSKPSNAWRLLVGKLDLLGRLVVAFGFGEGDKFVPKEVAMAFIVPCFENPNAEVRNAAVSATVECSKEDSKFVSKKIADIKPQIKEMLELKLQASGSVKKFQGNDSENNTKKSSSMKVEITTASKSKEEDIKEENQALCQFCLMHDPLFINDENLDRHLVDECPMLTDCVCQQVIEISDLTNHLITDTERHGNEASLCNRCGEAVLKPQTLKQHQEKNCKPGKDPSSFIRCPLCKLDIVKEDDESSWRNHLIHQCTKNPRRRKE